MGCRMKTTVELSDDLASAAREYAVRNGVTLRSLIERGLRATLVADRDRENFRLRDKSVGGRGIQSAYQNADWSRIRESIYEGRGG